MVTVKVSLSPKMNGGPIPYHFDPLPPKTAAPAANTPMHPLAQFERLLPHIRGNVGFVFMNQDLKEIREIITSNKVVAPARAGMLALMDVTVRAGNTGITLVWNRARQPSSRLYVSLPRSLVVLSKS